MSGDNQLLQSRQPLFRRLIDCKLAQSSQPGAIKVEEPDTNDADDTESAEKTGTLGNTKVVKQRLSKEHTTTSQCATEEVVGGKKTGSVHGIAQGDVDKDTLHDDEDCSAVYGDANGRGDPVDRLASCPGEEEETDRWTDGSWQSGSESGFLDRPAALGDARVHVVVEVGDVDGYSNDTGDEDAEEDEADLAEVHAVVDGVNTGEDLKDWYG